MKLFKIINPDSGYDDIQEMVVCAESIDDVKNRLEEPRHFNCVEATGFSNSNDYFTTFSYKKIDDLIIEEVILDEPKIICVDVLEG